MRGPAFTWVFVFMVVSLLPCYGVLRPPAFTFVLVFIVVSFVMSIPSVI